MRQLIIRFTLALIVLNNISGYCETVQLLPDTMVNRDVAQLVFCSDVHFGLTKENFRGKKDVTAENVSAAMIQQINMLPGMQLPPDNGVNSGKKIYYIDALIITGDFANREEMGIQSATKSWEQFQQTYLQLLHLKTSENRNTPLLLTPGNHDVSNAIGFRRPMLPAKDAASLIGVYNMMMHPVKKKDKTNFNFEKDKIHYSVDLGGAHLVFVQLWPDSAERSWMEQDLSTVNDTIPVFIFTHSIPDVEARFFVNPNGSHDVNNNDKFENLLSETFKDGHAITVKADIEQRKFADFIKIHPNIKAFFHGHNNYTEFYDWKGPDSTVTLHCFRVDSPMKGRYSAHDETKLSFELISFNRESHELTVRECLWNTEPLNTSNPIKWGTSVTVTLN
ncbi:MAG: metallophosphoesterase [Chitinophagaceae bacterium]